MKEMYRGHLQFGKTMINEYRACCKAIKFGSGEREYRTGEKKKERNIVSSREGTVNC